MTSLTKAQLEAWRDDGVVHLPRTLDAPTLGLAEAMYVWSVANPSPSACRFYRQDPGTFYQDLGHPRAAFEYRKLLTETVIPDLVADLWGTPEVWFLYEQIFLKEGADTRRTPWHQDAPYLALEGPEIAVMWISFEPLAQTHSLEFVRGSHRGPLYDGSSFDAADDTKPIYARGLPRLPNIEAARDAWDIVSFATEPGDVVMFHPAVLHGGAPTTVGQRRRTLSLRFFGASTRYAVRPTPAPAPLVAGLHDALHEGDLFRHAAFPKLRPTPLGFDAIPGIANPYVTPARRKSRP